MMGLSTRTNSAVFRALIVPELLEMIIRTLDKSSLAKAARTCKKWSVLSLSYLWEEQTDLRPLLNLLAPNGFQLRSNKPDFKVHPRERDWCRFFMYSGRIKSLKVDDTDETYVHLLDAFARIRPFHLGLKGNLFPNLRTLEWIAPNEASLIERSILFMHSGIQTLVLGLPPIYLHTRPTASLAAFVDHVIDRMPYIMHLSVAMHGYMSAVESHLLHLVKGLSTTLVSLEVPRFWVTTALFETLSTFPRFRTLQASHRVLGVYDPSRRFLPAIPRDTSPWRSLERLHLGASFEEVETLLRTHALPSSLVELFVYTPRLEPRRAVRSLCAFIAERCSTLQCLMLGKCHARQLEQTLRPTLAECPSIDDLLPLFSALPGLIEFAFHHEFPLVFPESKVQAIAKRLRNIVYLDLNPSPDYEASGYAPTDFPSLKCIPVLGRYCPNLQELGVYVSMENGSTEGMDVFAMQPLDYLAELTIGGPGSIGMAIDDVLLFLSKVLYVGCQVVSASVHRARGVPRAVAEARDTFWRRVNERLPVVIKARVEEAKMIAKLYDVIEMAEAELKRIGGSLSMFQVLDGIQGDEDDEGNDRVFVEGCTAGPPPLVSHSL